MHVHFCARACVYVCATSVSCSRRSFRVLRAKGGTRVRLGVRKCGMRALPLVHLTKLASLRVREAIARAACSLTRRPCSGQVGRTWRLQTAPALMPALSKGEGAMRDWIRARPTKRRCVRLRACGVYACMGAVLGKGGGPCARACMYTGDHGGWVPAVEVRLNRARACAPALRSFTLYNHLWHVRPTGWHPGRSPDGSRTRTT